MRQLPVPARVYLAACYLAGFLSLLWGLVSHGSPIRLQDWALGASLAGIAALCQVFAVARHSTTGQRSDHLTLAPLFAALLLLPRPLLVAVVIVTFLPEWYVYRRAWFGQLFNISAFLTSAVLSRLLLLQLAGHDPLLLHGAGAVPPGWAVIALIPAFEGTQALLLALVLRLARGQSLRQSGLFAADSLLLELGLISVGLAFAIVYLVNPIVAPVTALPLLLIFNALHVPNLKEEAATDPKTGLANMRHFEKAMAQALLQAQRHGTPVSLLVCDLDYLRNINNTYGHQAGDVVLVGIARVLRQHVRVTDLVGRFGGEEFVILLPQTSGSAALSLAENLRHAVAQTPFVIEHADSPIRATMSCGVATCPHDGHTYESLLREADLAVYQAKREGRNRVVRAGRASRELAVEWAKDNLVSAAPSAPPPSPLETHPLLRLVERATGSVTGSRRWQSAADGSGTSVRARTGHGQSPQTPLPVLLFVALVLTAGAASLGLQWTVEEPVRSLALLLFGGLTAIAEQMSLTSTGRHRISVSTVPIVAAALLWGALGLLVTAFAAALSIALKTRSAPSRFCFNLGTIILSAQAAVLIFRTLVGSELHAVALTSVLVPALLAGLGYHVVNQLLLCTVRGLQEGRRPWQIWREDYRWLWPHYLVLGGLSVVVALGFLDHGVAAVVVLTAPVAMMDMALRQYVTRTKGFMDELQHLNGRLTDSYEATLQALTRALDTRDEETEEHSQRVRAYTALLAEHLGVPAPVRAEIERGALLHDIGKIGVPDAILLKPGRLSPDEIAIMRKHPEIGYSMIAHIPFLAEAAKIVLYHHEAYDGSGYPSGLAGQKIPLGARIFAVADTLDAMTSDRPYRTGRSLQTALDEIQRYRGTQFDPAVVEALLTIPEDALRAVRELDHAGDPQLPAVRLPDPVMLA